MPLTYCRAFDPTSRFHGLEMTTAAFNSQLAPSSLTYYAGINFQCQDIYLKKQLTLVIIFAPKENPIPNNGLLGNFPLSHLTVCLQSQVDLALNKIPLVILCCAQPLEFTTQASHCFSPLAPTKGPRHVLDILRRSRLKAHAVQLAWVACPKKQFR